MIKRIETENEKEQVYELICLEVQEELIYKKKLYQIRSLCLKHLRIKMKFILSM